MQAPKVTQVLSGRTRFKPRQPSFRVRDPNLCMIPLIVAVIDVNVPS